MNFAISVITALILSTLIVLACILQDSLNRQEALENRITVLQLAFNDLKKNQDILIDNELTTIIPFEEKKEKKK